MIDIPSICITSKQRVYWHYSKVNFVTNTITKALFGHISLLTDLVKVVK